MKECVAVASSKELCFGGIKDMLDFIKSRRSTRKFKNEAVPAEFESNGIRIDF